MCRYTYVCLRGCVLSTEQNINLREAAVLTPMTCSVSRRCLLAYFHKRNRSRRPRSKASGNLNQSYDPGGTALCLFREKEKYVGVGGGSM